MSVQVRQYQGSRERKRQAATVEEQRRLKDERREQQLVATHEIEWFRERVSEHHRVMNLRHLLLYL